MKGKMLTKSIRLKKADAICLSEVMENDPRVERGSSEALRICYEDAALNIPDWKNVVEIANKFEFDTEINENDLETKSFVVADDIFNRVVESINTQLEITNPRISFVTRLCIYAAKIKVSDVAENTMSATSFEEVELLRRIMNISVQMIRRGKSNYLKEIFDKCESEALYEK